MDKAIEKLKLLKNIYHDYEEVVVGEELKVKLKLLNSEEETQVHSHAMNNFEQGLAYLYAVKRETLCNAIVSLNDTELPEIIEDVDAAGNKENVTRNLWLRENIIKGWNQMLVDEIWHGYTRLMNRVEVKINGGLKEEQNEEDSDNE
jgi:hypothetical protein